MDTYTEHLVHTIARDLPDWSRTNAAVFCALLRYKLEEAGCKIRAEVVVPNRGDGRKGRIDLVIDYPDRLVVEVDRKIIRRKSVFKMAQMPDYKAVSVLRVRE